VRAVDILGEENDDEELLAWAAANGRVFVTSDDGIHAAAHK
jgi:predicted nuclease of predicted toxin-antitoxin system